MVIEWLAIMTVLDSSILTSIMTIVDNSGVISKQKKAVKLKKPIGEKSVGFFS